MWMADGSCSLSMYLFFAIPPLQLQVMPDVPLSYFLQDTRHLDAEFQEGKYQPVSYEQLLAH